MKNKSSYKKYWDQNISRWGDLYLDISHGHEKLEGNKLVAWLYNRIVVPYESYLMKIRYEKTIEFIDQYVKKDTVVSDIGCGTGIFVVECLLRGAKVNALDISQSSLDVTRANVESKCPQLANNVTYKQCDAQTVMMPQSDCSICVGVLPYVSDEFSFLKNLLVPTNIAFIQYSGKYSFSNMLRRMLPFLNVRRLKFQTESIISESAYSFGFISVLSEKFATGKLLTFKKEN